MKLKILLATSKDYFQTLWSNGERLVYAAGDLVFEHGLEVLSKAINASKEPVKDLANMPSIEHLPSGGTRVIYNGKIFDLQGRVIRADELGDVSMLNRDQWVKKYGFRLKPHNRVLNFFRAFFRFN